MTLEEARNKVTAILSFTSGMPESQVLSSRQCPLPYCRSLIALWLRDNYRYSHSMIGKVIDKDASTVDHLLKMQSYVFSADSLEMRIKQQMTESLSGVMGFDDNDFKLSIKHRKS